MSKPSLSVAIPVYNFGDFIEETLSSIVTQERADEVEISVVDGASTDHTPAIMNDFCERYPQVRYIRLASKGGIDRDMATAFASTSGDYCWLFSGDDIMLPGALRRALEMIESGHDVYLSKHLEYKPETKDWREWPVLRISAPTIFDLSDRDRRLKYFELAATSEAFFSFMGGMVTKRRAWDRVAFNEKFDGSCWAHVARYFELMQTELTLQYVPETWQRRRPENDSFLDRGFVNRLALAVDGFHSISDTFFGHRSLEAFHVRRVIRHELDYGMFVMGKYLCGLNPGLESRRNLNRTMLKAYSDMSFANLKSLYRFLRTPASDFEKWQPEIAARYKVKYGRRPLSSDVKEQAHPSALR